MEEIKRGRGRPRLDTKGTISSGRSRRQKVNSMYMYKAVQLILDAATEITDISLLWYSDDTTWTVKSKDGILEQIGRMLVQDKHERSHCIFIANLSISALKNGCTSKEVEKAIRKIRTTLKKSAQKPCSTDLISVAGQAVTALRQMGEGY